MRFSPFTWFCIGVMLGCVIAMTTSAFRAWLYARRIKRASRDIMGAFTDAVARGDWARRLSSGHWK